MSNPSVAELIATGMRDGLLHPGNAAAGQKPTTLALPIFSTAGMPAEMTEHVAVTTKLIGEAIVALIEQNHTIIARDELAGLRETAAEREKNPPKIRPVGVHCHCDRTRTNPLIILNITDKPYVTVDGGEVITALTRRDPKCPHTMRDTP